MAEATSGQPGGIADGTGAAVDGAAVGACVAMELGATTATAGAGDAGVEGR